MTAALHDAPLAPLPSLLADVRDIPLAELPDAGDVLRRVPAEVEVAPVPVARFQSAI
jgi:FXSXX-COOH protein